MFIYNFSNLELLYKNKRKILRLFGGSGEVAILFLFNVASLLFLLLSNNRIFLV